MATERFLLLQEDGKKNHKKKCGTCEVERNLFRITCLQLLCFAKVKTAKCVSGFNVLMKLTCLFFPPPAPKKKAKETGHTQTHEACFGLSRFSEILPDFVHDGGPQTQKYTGNDTQQRSRKERHSIFIVILEAKQNRNANRIRPNSDFIL